MQKQKNRIKVLSAVTVSESIIFFFGLPSFLKKNGYEVAISSSSGPEFDKIVAEEGPLAFPVHMKREPSPWSDLVSLFRIIGILRHYKPDVVNAGTPKAGFLFILAAWLLRVPVRVYHLRGLRHESMNGFAEKLQVNIEKLTGMMATHVICETESLLRLSLEQGLFSSKKCTVLGPGSSGVELESYNPHQFSADERMAFRQELGIDENGIVIGFLGRMVPRKGVAELIVAWQSLKDRYPNAFLLLVGPEEAAQPLDAETLSLIKADPKIIAVGRQMDTAKFYSAMDIFTLPSHWEGFGNVLVEAAAMGLPVVTTNGTGTCDAVKAGFNALTVAPKDSDALAKALSRYCDDAELRREHGENGKEWAKRFDRQKIFEHLLKFYQTVERKHTSS